MTEPLAPEIKRLHKLTPAALADEVGELKAQIAALDERLEGYKAEGIRRGLAEIDGKLLRCVMGDPFVNHFSKPSHTDWVMRCVARKAP